LSIHRHAYALRALWGLLLVLTGGPAARAALTLGVPQPLSAVGQPAEKPVISPDGRRLAFVSDRDGADNLWIVDLEGGRPVALTHERRAEVQISGPSWSPDGDFLVYASNKGRSNSLDLWVISADGQHDEALTTDGATEWMPAWSPAGNTIAFVTNRDGLDALYLINLDGSGLRKLVDLAYEPAWHPDGNLLAAFGIRDADEGVFLIDPAAPAEARLLLPAGRQPAFSPDGRYVAAVRAENGATQLCLADLQRDTVQSLGAPQAGLAWPTWSAQGPAIAYQVDGSSGRQVMLATLDISRPMAAILEPRAGASIRGGVAVEARVGGEAGDVGSWRLEVGAGASPSHWTTLAEGTGAVDGAVARWNTTGLEGLHTLRLTAVSGGGETSVATVPVTVFGQYGVEWSAREMPSAMTTGALYDVSLDVHNSGTMTWRTDGQFAVYGSYQWLREDGRVVVAEGLRTPLPQDVEAGATASLKGQIQAPPVGGLYRLRFDLRQGGQVWFHELGAQPYEQAMQVGVPYAYSAAVPAPPLVMVPGQFYTMDVRLANQGAEPWAAGTTGRGGPVMLTSRWQDETGAFVDANPLFTPLPSDVAPGESLSLSAKVQAPSVNGRYTLMFDLQDTRGLFSDRMDKRPAGVAINVASPYGVEFVEHTTPGRMFPAGIQQVSLQAKNTGSLGWRASGAQPIRVSYHWESPSGDLVAAPELSTPLPYDVAPGQVAALAARVQAPGDPGEYRLVWDLSQYGGKRFAEMGNLPLQVPVMVGAPTHSVRWEQVRHPVELVVGSLYTVELVLHNTGSMVWPTGGAEGVRLGYHWLRASGEELARPPLFTDLATDVLPGDATRVTARVQAPDRAGEYLLRWDLYQGGYGWFSARDAATLDLPVVVAKVYGAQYLSHDTPTKLVAGQRYKVNLRLQNTGTIPWETSGPVPVQLSYRWFNAAGDPAPGTDAIRTSLPITLQPGESIEVAAYLQAPAQPGQWDLEWDLLFAGTFWFSEKAVPPLRVPVQVE